MTFEINTNKKVATKWEDIPDGIFVGKRQAEPAWRLSIWMKLGNDLYFIQVLEASEYGSGPQKMLSTPKEMFEVESIAFKGV